MIALVVISLEPGIIIESLCIAVWVMIPAYIPNPAAVILGGGRPIDGGRLWRDQRRIFGDGKTWRGLAGGIAAGIAVGVCMLLVQEQTGWGIHTPLTIVAMPVGALAGDLVKSFFKRRLNKERGEEWLIADQYDLVAGSLVLTLLVDPAWIIATITPAVLLWIVILTPLLHRGANIIGYVAGLKDVPW